MRIEPKQLFHTANDGRVRTGLKLALATGAMLAAGATASTALASQVAVSVHQIPGSAKMKNATVSLAPAPAGGASEWAAVTPRVAVNSSSSGQGMRQVLLFTIPQSGATAAVTTSRDMYVPSAGHPAELLADGSDDWIWDGSVVSVTAQGVATNAGRVDGGVGFVAGPGPNLFTTDNGGLTFSCKAQTPADCHMISALSAFRYNAPGGPDGLAAAGGRLWEVLQTPPASGLLESTTSGKVSGPYDKGLLHGDPGDALIGRGGYLYAAGLARPGAGTFAAIYRIPTGKPSGRPLVYARAAGIPPTAGISALTVGPGGNIFFEDNHSNEIGALNLGNHHVTEYKLPAGYYLPGSGAVTTNTIASGPGGSNAVLVSAHNKAGVEVVIEYSFAS